MMGLKGRIERIEQQIGPSFRGRLACIRPTESHVGPATEPGAAPGAIVRSEHGPGLSWDVPCWVLYVAPEHAADPVGGLTWRQRGFLRPDDRMVVEWWDHDPAAGILSLPADADDELPPTWSEVEAGRGDPSRN